MKVYRASKGPAKTFDPLNSGSSVRGPLGWRWNDLRTEILYTAEREALAILEVALRPGWDKLQHIIVASIEIPDGLVLSPGDLGIVLPSNWNNRPATDDSRVVAREFLDAVAAMPIGTPRPIGLRVPSVVSSTDFNILIDPSRKADCKPTIVGRIPFMTLSAVAT